MSRIANRPFGWGLALTLVLTIIPAGGMSAELDSEQTATAVTIGLASGRSFAGAVDGRTDEDHLWLRWESGGGVILRPVRWDRIVRAELDGRAIPAGRIGESLLSAASVHPQFPPPGPPTGRIVLAPRPEQGEPPSDERVVTIPPAPDVVAAAWTPRRVQSLEIEVGVANWDADVEVDGLVLDVYPLDAQGQTLAVTGTLQVELMGRRTGIVRRPWPFLRLGRWTEVLRPDMVGANGARFRLPFQAGNPQREADLSSFGLVHVRLNAPGHGVFEASDSTVRIRPYGVLRDQLQEHTGGRFFPSEMTGHSAVRD